MPRGKRTVYAMFCTKCGQRVGESRYFKQDKQGKSLKDHTDGMKKYCSVCKEKVDLKFKEERHSK